MKKYLKKYLELSRFKQIVIAVFAFHIFFTFVLLVEHLISSRIKKPKALVVRTFKIKPPKPEPTQIVSKPANKNKPKRVVAAPKPKQVALKRKSTPKKVVPKTKSPVVTKHPKPKPDQNDTLLKEIAESFDVFKSENKKLKHMEIDLPSKINSEIVVEHEEEDIQVSYGEFIITYLQNSLDLPEYGNVKAKLTIDQLGRLIQFQIVETKSKNNADFLKSEVQELAFPRLDEFGIKDSFYTFTITFRNLEIH